MLCSVPSVPTRGTADSTTIVNILTTDTEPGEMRPTVWTALDTPLRDVFFPLARAPHPAAGLDIRAGAIGAAIQRPWERPGKHSQSQGILAQSTSTD